MLVIQTKIHILETTKIDGNSSNKIKEIQFDFLVNKLNLIDSMETATTKGSIHHDTYPEKDWIKIEEIPDDERITEIVESPPSDHSKDENEQIVNKDSSDNKSKEKEEEIVLKEVEQTQNTEMTDPSLSIILKTTSILVKDPDHVQDKEIDHIKDKEIDHIQDVENDLIQEVETDLIREVETGQNQDAETDHIKDEGTDHAQDVDAGHVQDVSVVETEIELEPCDIDKAERELHSTIDTNLIKENDLKDIANENIKEGDNDEAPFDSVNNEEKKLEETEGETEIGKSEVKISNSVDNSKDGENESSEIKEVASEEKETDNETKCRESNSDEQENILQTHEICVGTGDDFETSDAQTVETSDAQTVVLPRKKVSFGPEVDDEDDDDDDDDDDEDGDDVDELAEGRLKEVEEDVEEIERNADFNRR